MKKYSTLTPFIAAAALSLFSTAAPAHPIFVLAKFICPDVSMVSNFGKYIAGFGTEFITHQSNKIYFESAFYPTGVPANLSNYSNSATNFNSVSATVTCSYASTNSSEQEFDLNYFVTNGYGGRLRQQTNNTIHINFPIGLKVN